jgi:alkylhydroperoxidase family enzyme
MARVPYQGPDDLDEKYSDLVVSTLQPGKTTNVYSAIGNNGPVLKGFRDFLGSLWTDSGLTDRQRELVILTAAATVENEYEWHQHVNIAQDEYVSNEELAAIADGDDDAFEGAERALVRYARAVVEGEVTDDLHDDLAAHFDDATVSGAACTAAGYLGLGRTIDALGVEVEEDDEFVGWHPE